MDILPGKSYQELVKFLPQIRMSLEEWQLVDIRLAEDSKKEFPIEKIGDLIHAMFHDKDGKIYLCSDHEALMIIRGGANTELVTLARQVESTLPKGSCEVRVHETTADKLSKLEIFVKIDKSSKLPSFAEKRRARRENVILVADDDMYMRMLVKKGVGPEYKVLESTDGSDVLANYKKFAPDIVFLDIHMPGKYGLENLRDILSIDPEAHIVMLSADSSAENVEWTRKQGVKGFLTKPFTKEKLMEHVNKCPTIF
jgi:two-component system, chemotaxis family, chemotaxis protein CheY